MYIQGNIFGKIQVALGYVMQGKMHSPFSVMIEL